MVLSHRSNRLSIVETRDLGGARSADHWDIRPTRYHCTRLTATLLLEILEYILNRAIIFVFVIIISQHQSLPDSSFPGPRHRSSSPWVVSIPLDVNEYTTLTQLATSNENKLSVCHNLFKELHPQTFKPVLSVATVTLRLLLMLARILDAFWILYCNFCNRPFFFPKVIRIPSISSKGAQAVNY